jgi:hypothetical protein
VDGDIEPAMVEIVAKYGTTYRVYGDRAVLTPATSTEPSVSKEWQHEIDNDLIVR